ncbi:hypothetical protein D9M70_569390 [compost metagenome]
MGADGVDPVLLAVGHPNHRQGTSVRLDIGADHRITAGPVLQQAQVALALVEEVLLQRREGQVEIEAGQLGGVLLDSDAGMELLYEWAQ